MKYITGSPRNEETEVDSEATFTALGWFLISILIGWDHEPIIENHLKLRILKSLLTGSKVILEDLGQLEPVTDKPRL